MAQSSSHAKVYDSPRSSPSHSGRYDQTDVNLPIDVLISYLVAAKRSLSSIHLVQRATTLLSEARSTIESTAAILARTKYLRKSLASQIKILRGIQYEIEGATQGIKSEIQAVVAELELVKRKLQQNVETLKATKIEPAFRQSTNTTQDGALLKETLHDFIDDKPIDELNLGIENAIDDVGAAGTRIDARVHQLEEDLQTVNASLDNEKTVTSSSTDSNLKSFHVQRTLKALETHAHEMAVSLESLVRHFDLCVTAIKYTEGAGALVAKTLGTDDLPEGVNVHDLTSPEHERDLSYEERAEMLAVLQNDAGEVDEVVLEMQDRAVEMDVALGALSKWHDQHYTVYSEVNAAFALLDTVSTRLPGHVAEIAEFQRTWQDVSARILDGQNGLSELDDMYTGFLDSYDGLIVEAARRRAVKKQMLKVINEAQSKLEQLYDADLNERQMFRMERGDFLPSDIWTGLGDLPSKWELKRIDGPVRDGESGNNEESIPELPRRTVEEALRRLRNKVEGEMSTASGHNQSNSGSASRT